MSWLIAFLLTAIVTAISLLIISRLHVLGIEVDSPQKALIAGLVFGVLNAIVRPLLTVLGIPFIVLTFGLFLFVINAIIFGLAALLVEGFRLRKGLTSALLGSIALSIVNSVLFWLLGVVGLPLR